MPLSINHPIPIVPAPLRAPDPDVPLDLGLAIRNIYDRASYDLRMDYTQPPPQPDFPPADAEWMAELLRAAGAR